MKSKHFVFIVDSYWYLMTPDLPDELRDLGLENKKSYELTTPDCAESIFKKNDEGFSIVESEKLLVFMSTFFSDAKPAIVFAKKIKEANPEAKIVFRSTLPLSESVNSVFGNKNLTFDKYMRKSDDSTELLKFITDFIAN